MMINVRMNVAVLFVVIAFVIAGPMATLGQDEAVTPNPGSQLIEPEESVQSSEFVTINVRNAQISEVLKAYSLQTGQSIVVGPDVVSENVNVRLNNIPWEEALDVILKPYGFGYRVVGETIVVSKLENIVTVEGIEPLVSQVFNLKFLDAYDIQSICTAQLSGRGKFTILETKGLPGWEFGGGGSSGGSSVEGGIRARRERDSINKSKTFVVTDVPSAITQIHKIIEEIDVMPLQVLIEAKFLEISSDVLTDIGLDFATGENGLATAGVQYSNGEDKNRWGVEQNDAGFEPSAFNSLASGLSGELPFNSGLQLLFSRVGGEEFQIMLHALEENGDVNILSAPKVLTLNNQEAAILVGTKYPIIESQSGGSAGGGASTSTSLDYYENIGIQLNVIPQVCNDDYINMIVHPAVSEIKSFVTAKVRTSEDAGAQAVALTEYPELQVREAETQIQIKSGSTAVIGGLQQEREQDVIHKVPLLGDIPFLGRLFRRETTDNQKIDLLIFIKATIVGNEDYAEKSSTQNSSFESRMNLDLLQPDEPEEISPEPEAVMVEEPVVVAEAEPDLIELVDQMEASAIDETNAVDVVAVEVEVEDEDILTLVEQVEAANEIYTNEVEEAVEPATTADM